MRSLSDPHGSVSNHLREAADWAQKVSRSVPPGVPSATRSAAAFEGARVSISGATQALASFSDCGIRFAATLASGMGTALSAQSSTVGATSPIFAVPPGYTMVNLSDIEDVDVNGYKQDVTPDDLAWGLGALQAVVGPGISRGLTLEDFRQMDDELGQCGNRSYAGTYNGFFSKNECIVIEPSPNGKFHPGNGRHRIAVARSLGMTTIPVSIGGAGGAV